MAQDEDHGIDEATLMDILEGLDSNEDGVVSKDEYKLPYMKLFPKTTDKQYDAVWKKMDKDGDGCLSFEEMAHYYGFDLKKSKGDQGMSDDQILEALQMQSMLHEMQLETDKKRASLGSPAPDTKARGRRRHTAPAGAGFKQRLDSSGVRMIKMPAAVSLEKHSPEILFMQECDVGDEAGIRAGLEDEKLDVRIVDERGEMPLHKLCRHGLQDSIKRVILKLDSADKMKHDLNWQDKQGKSPIFYAAEYGHSDLVASLLDLDVDQFVESSTGWTFLHTAVNGNREAVVSTILSHPKCKKAQLVKHKDRQDRTPLHIASFKENGNLTKLLLQAGSEPSLTDATGHTPLALAKRSGQRAATVELEAILKTEAYPVTES